MKLQFSRQRPPSRAEADRLERWFGASAATSFPTDADRLAGTRAAVLAAYATTTSRQTMRPGRGLRLTARSRRKLVVGLGMALLLVGGAVGLVAAADGPGQPFYGLRLTIESLTLPAQGTPARLTAQLQALESRLDEAAQATLRGDDHAADDALAAVDAKLADILAETPAGADLPDEVKQGLAHAEEVLTHLVQTLPAAAVPGLERALERVNLAQAAQQSGPVGGPGNANNPGQAGGPGNASGHASSSAQPSGAPASSGGPGNAGGSQGANGNGPPGSGQTGAGASHGPVTGPGSTKGRSEHGRSPDATPGPSASHGAP